MKKVQKLTPSVIKQIIAEEENKMLSKKKVQTPKRSKGDAKNLLSEIEKIEKIDRKASEILKEYKKLIEAKKILQKRLVRKL
jgi:hypothetical protein